MNTLIFELRFILQSRLAAGALIVLLALVSLSVWSGFRAVDAQQAVLARIAAEHQDDVASIAAKYKSGGNAGDAAYYTFHLTWDEPSPLAFVAFGQRDLQPYSLRVRLLGLHSQLYESETFNPELALPGRFDFAFVLIYLVPLFVIALLHDGITGEREAGRLHLLMSLPIRRRFLWWHRAGLRYAVVMAAILLPLLAGHAVSGADWKQGAGVVVIAALYTAFWVGLSVLVSAMARSSAGAAAILLGMFVFLTLLLPTIANAAINRLVAVGKGVELAMAQRQEVHQGWDLPKPVIFEKFFRNHPEWSDTPPVKGRFHWKWYYAMHQVGDEAVGQQAEQYRHSMMQREEWTRKSGWLLPAAAAQVALHRLADTDLPAQIAYRDQIAKFHAELRHFFYPFVFLELPFGVKEFLQLPVYRPRQPTGSVSLDLITALALAALGIVAGGLVAVRRIQPVAGETGAS